MCVIYNLMFSNNNTAVIATDKQQCIYACDLSADLVSDSTFLRAKLVAIRSFSLRVLTFTLHI